MGWVGLPWSFLGLVLGHGPNQLGGLRAFLNGTIVSHCTLFVVKDVRLLIPGIPNLIHV